MERPYLRVTIYIGVLVAALTAFGAKPPEPTPPNSPKAVVRKTVEALLQDGSRKWTRAECDGLAEGLYLLYAAEPGDLALQKLQDGLRQVLTKFPPGESPERAILLAARFHVINAPQIKELAGKAFDKNLALCLAEVHQRVCTGQTDMAQATLMSYPLGTHFSLRQEDGLAGLHTLVQATGLSAEVAAESVWAMYESAPSDRPYIGALLFSVRQLYDHIAFLDSDIPVRIFAVRIKVIESLLCEAKLLDHVNAGGAYFADLQTEIDSFSRGLLHVEKVAPLTKRLADLTQPVATAISANRIWLDILRSSKAGSISLSALQEGQMAVINKWPATAKEQEGK